MSGRSLRVQEERRTPLANFLIQIAPQGAASRSVFADAISRQPDRFERPARLALGPASRMHRVGAQQNAPPSRSITVDRFIERLLVLEPPPRPLEDSQRRAYGMRMPPGPSSGSSVLIRPPFGFFFAFRSFNWTGRLEGFDALEGLVFMVVSVTEGFGSFATVI